MSGVNSNSFLFPSGRETMIKRDFRLREIRASVSCICHKADEKDISKK
ncbi:hypothetical protein BRYFOR_05300 [Marvinbryantia formatexigens DSM 14469]|uniref:Uncharacterized protein n=1 Tax=Marvinbryantia formatexigens DSM 14469 TaxID=478749 RepID=C6L9L1_9FIRM|nr:hypothetical protein BRYFOR_05300 [Marvinbryantia formatexigens DSM 14469]